MRLSQNSTCEKNRRCLAAGLLSLFCGKERSEARQPLLAAAQQVPRGELVGKLLQAFGGRAFDEGIGALLEVDALLVHSVRQPVMLIEADPGRERKIRTDAHEHPPPLPVVDVEVVLDDPAVGDRKMPAVRLAVADRRHDARRLACLEDDHDRIGGRALEIRLDEFVATAFRCLHNGDVSFFRPAFEPGLKLIGNATQRVPAHRIELPVGVEEADDPLRLLERLDQSVQQNPIEAPVAPANAILVMFVERVHERPPLIQHQQNRAAHAPHSTQAQRQGISRAKPLAS
jgi:hypothetical protein